jgi:hypothetical protein
MPAPAPTRRRPLMLGIAAALFVSALGSSAPMRADPSPDPAEWPPVVVKQVQVQNDRDPGGNGAATRHVSFCAEDALDPRCPDAA